MPTASPSARPRAVIFDCDGTLIDSERTGIAVLHEQATQAGLALSLDEAWQRFRGTRMAACVGWIAQQLRQQGQAPQADFDAVFTARVRAAMHLRFAAGIALIPGAAELLPALRLPHCIATNGPREKLAVTLPASGLDRYFPAARIFCADELDCFKPDPGLFLHAARAMGVAAADCAVVEDSLPGIQAGLAAGMQVYTLHPPTPAVHRLDTPPSRRLHHIDDLHALRPVLL